MHLCVFVNKRVHDMFMHKVTSFHYFCFVAVVLIETINMNDIYSSLSRYIFVCDILKAICKQYFSKPTK